VNGPTGTAARRRLEGVRVWGRIGNFVLVRDNHVSGAATGVRFVPVGALPKAPAWVVTHNLAERASNVVLTPSSAVATLLRGLGDNWA